MGAESVKPCFWIIESSLSSISWEKRLELFLADTLRQCDVVDSEETADLPITDAIGGHEDDVVGELDRSTHLGLDENK